MRRAGIVVMAVALILSLSSCGAGQGELDKARAEGAAAQLEKINADKAAAAAEAKAAAAAKAKAAAAAKAEAAAAAAKAEAAAKTAAYLKSIQWKSVRILGPSQACAGYGWKFQGVLTFQWRKWNRNEAENIVFRNIKSTVLAPDTFCPNGSYLKGELYQNPFNGEPGIGIWRGGSYETRYPYGFALPPETGVWEYKTTTEFNINPNNFSLIVKR
jgi:hypothetical protein